MAQFLSTEGASTGAYTEERTLFQSTVSGTYVLVTDLTNLTTGNTVTLKAYMPVRSSTGSTGNRQCYSARFAHVQSDLGVLGIPFPAYFGCTLTLTETQSTGSTDAGNSYNFHVVRLSS